MNGDGLDRRPYSMTKNYILKPQDAEKLIQDVCFYRKVQTFIMEIEGSPPKLRVTATGSNLSEPLSKLDDYDLIEVKEDKKSEHV